MDKHTSETSMTLIRTWFKRHGATEFPHRPFVCEVMRVSPQQVAALPNQLFLKLGMSGGRGVRDYCAVAEKLPELYTTAGSLLVNQQIASCAISEDWLTSVRGLATYTIPRVDLLVSGTFRSTPGVAPAGNAVASNGNSLSANYNVSSAILLAQAGRPLAPGLPFQTVNLLEQGHTFPDMLNSLDLRVGKNLRFGRTRYPVTNGATWLAPTAVLNARLARFNVTFDF